MKLSVKEGELMLPDGFAFEIEHNNPFFSSDGTASVPVSIPATATMRERLGFPDRIGRARRFVKRVPAFLSHQVFAKRCSMVIDSYGEGSGITASLAFEESRMYAELQEREVKDIFADETLTFPGAVSPSAISARLFELYAFEGDEFAVAAGNPAAGKLTAFPVALERKDGSFLIANEPDRLAGNFVCSARRVTVDEEESVPEGYGVVPFIFLNHFLERLFSLCGYSLVRNDLDREPFRRVVLLNNCVDALCGQSSVKYRDIVPSMTFGDVLEWLRAKFCAAVFVRGCSASIVLFERLCEDSPDADLSGFAQDGLSLGYPDPKRLRLECGTSIDGAAPAFGSQSALDINAVELADPEYWWDEETYPNGVFLVRATGQVLRRTRHVEAPAGQPTYSVEELGSNCVPLEGAGEEGEEAYSSMDEFVPQLVLGSPGALDSVHSALPYLGDRVHNHTAIGGPAPSARDLAHQDLMVCWCLYGDSFYRCGNSQPFDCQEFRQSLYSVGEGPSLLDRPGLTPRGLYRHCWRRYDSLLANSAPTVDVRLDLPVPLLLSLDLSKPKVFEGQKVLVVSYTMTISASSIRCTTARLQLLPSYEDAVDTLGGSPIPPGYRLEWDYVVTAGQDLVQYPLRWPLYTPADAPTSPPSYAGQVAMRRENWALTNPGDEYVPSRIERFEEWFVGVLVPLA